MDRNHMAGVDIVQRPLRRDSRFGKDKLGERGNFFGFELGGKALHLCRRTTVGDDFRRFAFLQAPRLSGSSAGPIAPSRAGPWHSAQCC